MPRRHHKMGGGRLPAEYRELEYIESTGSQYIDTGLQGNNRLGFELCYAQTVLANWNSDYHGHGVDNWNQRVLLRIDQRYTGQYFAYFYCNSNAVVSLTTSVLADTNFHTIYMTNGLQKFDGSVIGNTTITNNATYTFLLFAMRANSGVNHYAKDRVKYAKFWYDGNLERDYLPALRIADNKPGLYDLVYDQFYTKAGTGEFLYA